MFDNFKKDRAFKKLVHAVNSTDIIKDALHVIEAKYPKGNSPGSAEDVKLMEATDLVINSAREMGLTVYSDDYRVRAFIRGKLKGRHAIETMNKNSAYNETPLHVADINGSKTYH